MNKITLDEIIGPDRYEQVRDGVRRRIIELKKNRRVTVGDRVTLVFENHDTMLFQTQEMIRAERIIDIDRVREEIAVYNEQVPGPDELSATLLIEITDSNRIREDLISLIGIDECVTLRIGDRPPIAAVFEPGRSKEDRISAVQYVRFPLVGEAQQAFIEGTEPAQIVIEHPSYRHSAPIEGRVRDSLAADLRSR